VLATLTGLGLAAAAGLNAYIPLLVVGVLARLTDAVRLPPELAWTSSGWTLTILGLLLAVEVVLDKVPIVDHVNDVIPTAGRPAAGGASFALSEAATRADESTWMQANPWASWLLGIVVALVVHTAKAAARPAVNASTAGLGAPVASTVEDAGSLGLSLLAVLAPAVAVVALLVVAFAAVRVVVRLRRRAGRAGRTRRIRLRRGPSPGAPPPNRPGPHAPDPRGPGREGADQHEAGGRGWGRRGRPG
jgi:hypothetical protein